MSKTELLYNKILKISMFVAVISLVLLIVDLFVAVTKQAIVCSGTFCSIDSSETFFQVTLWLLVVLLVIFVVISRIMLFLLTRENKLEDAQSYKSRVKDQVESSDFSESKLYDDIRTNKITGKPKKIKTSSKMSGVIDNTKEFFSNTSNKTKEYFSSLKEKRSVKNAEKAVQKEVVKVEKEAAKAEKEAKLEAERAVELIRQEELAVIEEARLKEEAIEEAKEKELLTKENVLKEKELKEKADLEIAKQKEQEEKEAKYKVEDSIEEKEYFTRLNKTELIALVAKASDLSKAKCKLVVNAFVDTIVEELGNGNEVNIVKFGKFKKDIIKEKTETNSKTGKTKVIPQETSVKFLPDKVFKDMITYDIESTSDKNLFTKSVMKEMTEDEVQEQLIKEEKSREHLESKILKDEIKEPKKSRQDKKAEKALHKEAKRAEKEAARAEKEAKLEAKRAAEKVRLEELAVIEEARLKEEAIEEAKQKEIDEKARLIEEARIIEENKQKEKVEKARLKEEAKQIEKVEKAKLKEEAKQIEIAEKAKQIEIAEKAKLKEEAKQKEEAKLKAEKDAELLKQKELAEAEAKKQKEVLKPIKPAKPKETKKTKADIIIYIEEQTGISKNKSNKFLKFFAEVVKEELAKGEDVSIPGFGMFTTIEMPAKEAVNPQTNKRIIVPAHKQARLRFDDKFKKNFITK